MKPASVAFPGVGAAECAFELGASGGRMAAVITGGAGDVRAGVAVVVDMAESGSLSLRIATSLSGEHFNVMTSLPGGGVGVGVVPLDFFLLSDGLLVVDAMVR